MTLAGSARYGITERGAPPRSERRCASGDLLHTTRLLVRGCARRLRIVCCDSVCNFDRNELSSDEAIEARRTGPARAGGNLHQ